VLTLGPASASWDSYDDFTKPNLGVADSVNASLDGVLDDGKTSTITVHLVQRQGDWAVRGYAIAGRQVLGIEFTESSD
jgi:hypothetical protein